MLFHLLLLVSGVVVLPIASRLFGSAPAPEFLVMQINIDALLADVAPSSAVKEEVDSPILAEFNSRAHDRVDGDTGNLIPDGGAASLDNSIDGTMDDIETGTEIQAEELTQPEQGRPPQPEADREEGPRAPETSILDQVRPLELSEARTPSALSMFSGVPETPQRPGRGNQSRTDLGPRGASFGEFSFSTKAWEWEPYWVHMKKKLYLSWIPPAAYAQYGMLEGGYTLVEAVIERDGTVSSVTVLEDRHGHASLHKSSYSAMVGAQPFHPLPPGFPDETLVVTVRFIYLDPNRGAHH